jgi:hypothetical protein
MISTERGGRVMTHTLRLISLISDLTREVGRSRAPVVQSPAQTGKLARHVCANDLGPDVLGWGDLTRHLCRTYEEMEIARLPWLQPPCGLEDLPYVP